MENYNVFSFSTFFFWKTYRIVRTVPLSLIPPNSSAKGEIEAPEDTTDFNTVVRDVQTVPDSCSLGVVRVMYHLQYGQTEKVTF